MIYIAGNQTAGQAFYNCIKEYLKCGNSVTVFNQTEELTDLLKTNEAISKTAILWTSLNDADQFPNIGIKKNIYSMTDIEPFLEHMEDFADKPVLPYVEVHLSDHCNLNCKGCGHLSNIAPEKHADYDKFEKDIYRLTELFCQIKRIRLMGGEPFLNPDLVKFADLVRRENRDTDIRVVTNGLTLDKTSKDTLKQLADLHVQLDISCYPPTLKKKEQITAVLKKCGLGYRFSEQIDHFLKFRNPTFQYDPESAYAHCHMKMCTFLREGKMAACSFPVLYTQLDTFMKGKFTTDRDIIDLYAPGINGWKISWKLTHPLDSCRYCRTDRPEFYTWEPRQKSQALCEDWFVKE